MDKPTSKKRTHYDRNKEKNRILGDNVHVGVKTCSECKIEKQRSEFHKNLRTKDGLSGKCKTCQSDAHKRYYRSNADNISIRMKFQRIKKKYGLTKEEYYKLLNDQMNMCAICEIFLNNEVKVDVDHDHKTGKVRGILCTNCNSMLAHAKDDINTLMSGIKYLKERR